jgi:hypothetical protein
MTNRCYSDWFKDKYRAEIRSALWKNIATLWFFNKNDIMVPWKDNQWNIVWKRLYHIFSQKELNALCTWASFSHIEHFYVTTNSNKTNQEKDWRNIISIMQKTIYW